MHICVQACMCTQRILIFCLQKLWILWGLIEACWLFVWLLQNVFYPLGFLFFFFTFKITDCGACRLPCELLFFRRYGQKVGLAAVSIGYRAILKQNLRTLQTAFYVGLLAKRQACLHFALCKKKEKKSYTCVWGRGRVVQLGVKACLRTCWVMSSTCCVNGTWWTWTSLISGAISKLLEQRWRNLSGTFLLMWSVEWSLILQCIVFKKKNIKVHIWPRR